MLSTGNQYGFAAFVDGFVKGKKAIEDSRREDQIYQLKKASLEAELERTKNETERQNKITETFQNLSSLYSSPNKNNSYVNEFLKDRQFKFGADRKKYNMPESAKTTYYNELDPSVPENIEENIDWLTFKNNKAKSLLMDLLANGADQTSVKQITSFMEKDQTNFAIAKYTALNSIATNTNIGLDVKAERLNEFFKKYTKEDLDFKFAPMEDGSPGQIEVYKGDQLQEILTNESLIEGTSIFGLVGNVTEAFQNLVTKNEENKQQSIKNQKELVNLLIDEKKLEQEKIKLKNLPTKIDNENKKSLLEQQEKQIKIKKEKLGLTKTQEDEVNKIFNGMSDAAKSANELLQKQMYTEDGDGQGTIISFQGGNNLLSDDEKEIVVDRLREGINTLTEAVRDSNINAYKQNGNINDALSNTEQESVSRQLGSHLVDFFNSEIKDFAKFITEKTPASAILIEQGGKYYLSNGGSTLENSKFIELPKTFIERINYSKRNYNKPTKL